MSFLTDVSIPLLDLFGCLAFCFIVSLIFAWLLGLNKRRIGKLNEDSDPITAVLYDSKVENVVDMISIDRENPIVYAPHIHDTKNTEYHFFCIQDDGKHIYIERG